MITVAVASYNHFRFVEQCLESIVEQSYGDLELCWVDDCSKDDTFKEVARITSTLRFQRRFNRILIRRNSVNRGAAFSLNLAARMGRSELISFMNSDDYYHPDRLQISWSRFEGQHYFIWFSNVLPVDEFNANLVCDPTGERIAFDADIFVRRFGGVSNALLFRQIASSTGNFVVTRQLFGEIGGFQNLKYCHDWMFALHASRYCEPVFQPERLYYYRLHPSNSFKSLGGVAELETRLVLSSYFEALALKPPLNRHSPCPRRQPAAFWDILQATNVKEIAERVFFPYSRASRQLSLKRIRT